jgi:hypothetical protein
MRRGGHREATLAQRAEYGGAGHLCNWGVHVQDGR